MIDYEVPTGKLLQLKGFQGSGEGYARVELKTGPSGSEVTRAVAYHGVSDSAYGALPGTIDVVAGDKVLVETTNLDNQVQDVHAYISGAFLNV